MVSVGPHDISQSKWTEGVDPMKLAEIRYLTLKIFRKETELPRGAPRSAIYWAAGGQLI